MEENNNFIEKNNGLQVLFRILIFLGSFILSVYYSYQVVIQNNADFFSSKAVPIDTWLPCLLLYIIIGFVISGKGRRLLSMIILFWPLIHIAILIIGIGIKLPIFIYLIFPPFLFAGEAVSFGYLLIQLFIKDSSISKIGIILGLFIDLIFIYFGIESVISDELRGF